MDADYSKVDNRTYVEELQHLNVTEKALLLQVLDPESQTVVLLQIGYAQYMTSPLRVGRWCSTMSCKSIPSTTLTIRSHYTKKEIERFTKLGVFKKSHESE